MSKKLISEVHSNETDTDSKDHAVFPEYDSIDELAEQIRLAEDASQKLKPEVCFEIGILHQQQMPLDFNQDQP